MSYISVKDKLPDAKRQKHRHFASDTVSVFTEDGEHLAEFCLIDDSLGIWYKSGTYIRLNVTHWKPIEKHNANT